MFPEIFSIGPIEIRSYGLCVAIAFLVALFSASKLSDKAGFKKDTILDFGLILIMSSVIGARLLYIIVNWEYYAKSPASMFKVWEGGLVFFGGFVVAIIVSVFWLRHKKLPFLQIGDICMPFLALAHAIGRVGCFLNGCCYGVVSEKHGLIFPAIGDNLPHLPVQLYESTLNFINFIILIMLYKYLNKYKGLVFFMYFVNYGIIRIITELFRGDEERGFFLGLSTSSIIGLIVLLTGVAGMGYVLKKYGKEKTS